MYHLKLYQSFDKPSQPVQAGRTTILIYLLLIGSSILGYHGEQVLHPDIAFCPALPSLLFQVCNFAHLLLIISMARGHGKNVRYSL